MRKFFSVLLIFMLIFSLSSCTQEQSDTKNKTESSASEPVQEDTTYYKTDYFEDLSYEINSTWQPREYDGQRFYGTSIVFSTRDNRNEYSSLKKMAQDYMKNTMKSEKEDGLDPKKVSLKKWRNSELNGIMAIWDSDSGVDAMRTYDLFIDYNDKTYSITCYGEANADTTYNIYERVINSLKTR